MATPPIIQTILNKWMQSVGLLVLTAALAAGWNYGVMPHLTSPEEKQEMRDALRTILERLDRIDGRFDEIDTRFDDLERKVDRQTVPRVVTSLGRRSGPVRGRCYIGEGVDGTGGCPIDMVIFRTSEARSCLLAKEQPVEYFWRDQLNGIEYEGRPNNQVNQRNLTLRPFTFSFNVPVPLTAREGFLDYCYRAYYNGCPGTFPEDKPYTPPEPVCIEDVPVTSREKD